MDFSAKLDHLQQDVAKTKADAQAAAKESRDQLRQRIDQAQAEVDTTAKEAQAGAQSKWAQMKGTHDG